MIAFCVASILMFAAAMMFLLPPVLRSRNDFDATAATDLNLRVLRDQLAELDSELRAGTISDAQHAEARRELERSALQGGADAAPPTRVGSSASRYRSAGVVAALVAVVAFGMYVVLGAPESLSGTRPSAAEGDHGLNAERIVALVERLSTRLKAEPDDGQGWAMLARSYGVLGRHQDALIAYQNALKRIDGNAQLLVDYADTLALLRGRKLAGEPYELVKRALTIDPRNVKALALAGTAEFDAGNATGAIAHWEKVLTIVPVQAPFARSIAASIAQARQQPGSPAAASATEAVVVGTVSVSAQLAAKVNPADTVYVFARAAEGPRMPLAIMKRSAGELPFPFRLDDSTAMAGGRKLSQAANVVVGARISRSGSATRRSGDMEVVLGPRRPDGSPVELVIDRVLP